MTFVFTVLPAGRLPAQTPLRSSLVRSAAAADRSTVTTPYYNLRVGPVFLRADVALETRFNDNVNLADKQGPIKPESDLILRPQLNLAVSWQVSRLNTLALNLGMGVEKYLGNAGLDTTQMTIAPGSQISFDVFVADFRINVHDQFSLEQDPVSDAAVANVSKLGRFTNTIGLEVAWDLNAVVLFANYDHTNVLSLEKETSESGTNEGQAPFDDSSQEAFALKALIPVGPGFNYGAQATFSTYHYLSETRSDQAALGASLFLEAPLSHYTTFSITGGFRSFTDESPPASENAGPRSSLLDEQISRERASGTGGSDGVFGSLNLANRLNSRYTHALSLRRETESGLSAARVQRTVAAYTASSSLNSRVRLGLDVSYERGEEQGSTLPETYGLTTAGLTATFLVSSRISCSASYRFASRTSNLPLRNYVQNVVGLQLSYAF